MIRKHFLWWFNFEVKIGWGINYLAEKLKLRRCCNLHSWRLFCKGVPVSTILRIVLILETALEIADCSFFNKCPSSQTIRSGPTRETCHYKNKVEPFRQNWHNYHPLSVFSKRFWFCRHKVINKLGTLLEKNLKFSLEDHLTQKSWTPLELRFYWWKRVADKGDSNRLADANPPGTLLIHHFCSLSISTTRFYQ